MRLVAGAAGVMVALVLGQGVGAATPAPAPRVAVMASTAGATRILLTPAIDPATSQRISWTTARAYSGQRVEYWPATSTGAASAGVPTASAPLTSAGLRLPRTAKKYSGTTRPRYRAELTGLRPGTSYTYRIVNSHGAGAPATFTAAATGTGPSASAVAASVPAWSFLVLGDTQVDQRRTVRPLIDAAVVAEPRAALVVQTGDVVDRPTRDSQWGDMFYALGTSATTRNYLAAIGNHEQCVLITCSSRAGQAFRSYYGRMPGDTPGSQTWFSVDYQGVRFVVLDSFGGHLAEQATFLDQALSSNPHRWSVVVMHAPLYATRPGRSYPEIRQMWEPIIQAHDVDLVLTGHDHAYARGQTQEDAARASVPVLVGSVSGPKFYDLVDTDWVGGGAVLQVRRAQTATFGVVRVTPTTLTYRAVVAAPAAQDAPGTVLDEVTITATANGSKRVTTRPAAGN